jgi:hypothetical protein
VYHLPHEAMGDEGYRLSTLLALRQREEDARAAACAEAARATEAARFAEDENDPLLATCWRRISEAWHKDGAALT